MTKGVFTLDSSLSSLFYVLSTLFSLVKMQDHKMGQKNRQIALAYFLTNIAYYSLK